MLLRRRSRSLSPLRSPWRRTLSQTRVRTRRSSAMAASINRVVLVGNLTRDPELRHTPGGTPVCSLRLAVNSRRKDESGQWIDKPNYFSISVFGNQAESCAQYLAKRRKCYFCKEKVAKIDYKNVTHLRRYISEKGKIRSRRITGACRRHQVQVE